MPFLPHAKRVLLIGWEGADWRLMEPLIETGQMPNLAGLLERGVMGNICSHVPMVCPVVWTSVATGVLGDEHRILGFVEPDGYGDVRPIQSTSRRRKALWNILSQRGLRCAVIGWPATYPAESINGIVVADRFPYTSGPASELWPADERTVHPPELRDCMMKLRLHPAELSFEQLSGFVPRLGEIDPAKDDRIVSVATSLAQAASVQNAATWIAEHEEWEFMAVHYAWIGDICHRFIRYHPPCADSVTKEDADLLQNVVEMAYRFSDMMLGSLMRLAGGDTLVIVVSDHGFYKDPIRVGPRSGGGRPMDPATELRLSSVRRHRRDAMFCAGGPGVKADELVFGASLVDVVPTVLAYLGQPVPLDMDGTVIEGLFKDPPAVESTESYEESAQEDGVHCRELAEDPWTINEIHWILSAVGLVSVDMDAAAALEACTHQRLMNLARIRISRGRLDDALGAYRELRNQDDSLTIQGSIVGCLLDLKRFDEAEAELERMTALAPDSPSTLFLQTKLQVGRGDLASARACLDRAASVHYSSPDFPVQVGWLALRLGRWDQAARLFELALGLDPEFPQAHEGMGVALLRMGRIEDSVLHHETSVRLLYNRSSAHRHLGESLIAAGRPDAAVRALRTALELDPRNARALEVLAEAYRLEASGRESD